MPPPWRWLNTWTFDDTNLLSSAGFPPRNSFGLYSVGSFSGNAVWLTGNSALLNYNEMETNGVTNITCDIGTLEFWFRPDWSSANNGGSGPGTFARLLELGAYTQDASYGWWSIYFDSGGTNIYFSAQTNGATTNYLSAPIQWSSNWWHIIDLTYSSTNSILFMDGQVAATGSGVTYWPGGSVRSNGFALGSDLSGTNVARGTFENLRIWADPFPPGFNVTNHQNFLIAHYNPNGTGGNSPLTGGGNFGPLASGGGGAFLPLPGLQGCVGNGLTLLSPSYHRGNPTNVTISFTGNDASSPYDLFYSTDLISWGYGGRIPAGVTSTNITNPPANAFYQLGTMQNADGDGYTDAYEMLVLHSNPYDNLPLFKVFITQPQAYSTVP